MKKRPTKPERVREPVQVYLDEKDRDLLDTLVARSALPKAELLRLGLRRLSADLLADDRPGGSMDSLIGVLDVAPGVPRNLSARHDDYLYGKLKKGDARRR
jgi:hypothetical protein